ncbi:MAG: amidohydrolase family protein, partial [Planctomycetota bacterium]
MKVLDIHSHMQKDDPEMNDYMKAMDENEVELTVVHGLPGRGIDNDSIVKAAEIHKGRLFGGVYVDLRKPVPECIDELKKYADTGLFKAVKLFPNVGYDPNADKYEPFWETAIEYNLYILSHCGWLGLLEGKNESRVCGHTARPSCFEVPARRHLDLNFVMAHFGGAENYLETIVMTSRLPNMFGDIAPGCGKWIFENEMPGLKGTNREHCIYDSDGPINNDYKSCIGWWKDTLTA